MKKIPQQPNSTKNRAILQQARMLAKWIGLFLGCLLGACVLGPLFLNTHHRAVHLAAFLNHYRVVFWLLHAVFIVSTLWWWPAYIRARGARNHWPEDMIQRASDWKWAVVLVLAFLCALFFLT